MSLRVSRSVGALLLMSGFVLPLRPGVSQQADDPVLPTDRAPHMVLAHPGPHAPVNALAFAPDGKTLFVAGFGKQIRRYQHGKDGWKAAGTLRVPIGPGNAGVINALAVSPDGRWVAAAGRAPVRGETWTGGQDRISTELSQISPLLRRDCGVVYLFDAARPEGGRVVRGQESEVRAMAFANPAPPNANVLITSGIEWDRTGKEYGAVHAVRVTEKGETHLGVNTDLPPTVIPPGLAAWATGPTKAGLRVAVAWDKNDRKPGQLLLWDDPGSDPKQAKWVADAVFNSPLATRPGPDGPTLFTGGYHVEKRGGAVIVRDAAGAEQAVHELPTNAGEVALPLRVAAIDGKSTAVLARVLAPDAGFRHELLLHTGRWSKPVVLDGLDAARLNVLSASADGRFVAVAGFTDNRVEVYDAASVAAGTPRLDSLRGAAAGFSRATFLTGDKLWVGGADDTPARGGAILDLDKDTRRAVRNDGKQNVKIDEPKGAAVPALSRINGERSPRRVSVAFGGLGHDIDLPPGETVTAAAFLPGKPDWDKDLRPILAVAHVDTRGQSVRVTLFDPFTKRALLRLAGPTLPVRSLAFSGAHPLLAGAGDDGTVAVWSMRNAARELPTVEGLFLGTRGDAVVVQTVEKGSPAAGKLKPGDEIESVANAKGVQQPVKAPFDFVLTVRDLKIGGDARIKVKNQAQPVAVKVGAATGFRYPLFTAWVDPAADKAGVHDWVAWTPSGPYDTNGATAEGRIGWQTSTGDPARPVALATVDQYRKLHYKPDFIRLLVETADYLEALKQLPVPVAPVLKAHLNRPTVSVEGLAVTREKPDGATVELSDPDGVLDPDRLRFEWRITGPGQQTEWQGGPFRSRRANLDLTKYRWAAGPHLVHVKLSKQDAEGGNWSAADEITLPFSYIPPAPTVAIRVNGAAPDPRAEFTTQKVDVSITVAVDAKGNPEGAVVLLSWSGGAEPVKMRRNPDGTYEPLKVPLKADTTTTIMARATNVGAVRADLESHSAEVQVRRLPPKAVAPPTVKLFVRTEYDARISTDKPYVVSTPEVVVQASVTGPNPPAEYQWIVGKAAPADGKWDPTTKTETRTIKLPGDGSPLTVRVRAKYKDSPEATDTIELRYDGLPEVSVTLPPDQVTSPDLTLSGGLKVVSNRVATVHVLVRSRTTGQMREFDPTPNKELTSWNAGVTLFPGVNELGYVIRYDSNTREFRKAGLVDVRYVRPPIVAAASPLDVGTGNVGAVDLAILAARESPPNELWANGVRTGFRLFPKPFRLFGATVWVARAEGVSVRPGADRLKPVPVLVRNAELASEAVHVPVLARAEVKAPPPDLRLTYRGGLIHPDQPLGPVSDPAFTFGMEVVSETPLRRVEVWSMGRGDASGTLIGGIKASDAVGAPGRFVLKAAPGLTLRPGSENRVRVVATNEHGVSELTFQAPPYTPPAVRIVIDTIREPNGRVHRGDFSRGVRVDSQLVDVEGRVLWNFSDDPVATDDNLEAVFVANGVAQLPVPVSKAEPGTRARRFAGRIYLNALDPDPAKPDGETSVRVVLRSGGLPMAVPQSASTQAAVQVVSTNPLRKRRLHVLVLGVEVPAVRRPELVQRVVRAVGGTIPVNVPNFTEGAFDRPGFESAYLYTPSLGFTNSGHLNALMNAVEADIRDRIRRPGEDWVNDVVLIYYEGKDWMDQKGWFLYSATTKYAPEARTKWAKAIRLDNLPQIPGVSVLLANVEGKEVTGVPLTVDVAALRYAWENANGLEQLLLQFANAIRQERTLNGVTTLVATALGSLPAKPVGYPRQAPPTVGEIALGVPTKRAP